MGVGNLNSKRLLFFAIHHHHIITVFVFGIVSGVVDFGLGFLYYGVDLRVGLLGILI